MKRFGLAFTTCLALEVALNLLGLLGVGGLGFPTHSHAGFPFTFWREGAAGNDFSPLPLVADLILVFGVSYRIGRWWERRGGPDYFLGANR